MLNAAFPTCSRDDVPEPIAHFYVDGRIPMLLHTVLFECKAPRFWNSFKLHGPKIPKTFCMGKDRDSLNVMLIIPDVLQSVEIVHEDDDICALPERV